MTVYNLNLGIGWASSGVEYAQAYRARLFRSIGQSAKFVFMDLIQTENIQSLTENLGLKDEEVIWLYQAFTDIPIAPTSYTLDELKKSFQAPFIREEVEENRVRYYFEGDCFITAYLLKAGSHLVNRAEFVSRGNLLRKDYYSYTRIYSEYYTPRDGQAYLYQRRFFNQDGTTAYEEITDDKKDSIFRFKDRILYSKSEFVGYFLEHLNLTKKDIVILDRASGIGQTVMENKGAAKLGVVVHAEHYSKHMTTEDTILWNNYYEYQFRHADSIDFFVTSTEEQKRTLEEQFKTYGQPYSAVYAIPVGSIDAIREPDDSRIPYGLVTASRLAGEKHLDWLVEAVVRAQKNLASLQFDIYGEGGERQKLENLIRDLGAENFIRLKGHQQLDKVYSQYQAYLTASTSEGFGLTLLEAIGSGLPIIGLDVPYGNPTFVRDGKNGYLIPRLTDDRKEELIDLFAEKIVQLFQISNLSQQHQASYERAKDFLTSRVEESWKTLIEEVTHD